MSASDDREFSGHEFSGRARLFPLPNRVFFPHMMVPLHVFEPRYRELLEDAMAGDRLIAMATLAPGWEAGYAGRPPVRAILCLGHITVCSRLPDGAHNILLKMLMRAKMVRELPPTRAFREAEVELLKDCYPPDAATTGTNLHRKLREAFLGALSPAVLKTLESAGQSVMIGKPLGILTDTISHMLDLDPVAKQALLAETNVHRRAELLLKELAAIAAEVQPSLPRGGAFPPQFHHN